MKLAQDEPTWARNKSSHSPPGRAKNGGIAKSRVTPMPVYCEWSSVFTNRGLGRTPIVANIQTQIVQGYRLFAA
jgi:hypothetical protein